MQMFIYLSEDEVSRLREKRERQKGVAYLEPPCYPAIAVGMTYTK
jgi:hypothetical protein